MRMIDLIEKKKEKIELTEGRNSFYHKWICGKGNARFIK